MRMYIYILIFLLVLVGNLTPQVALASTTYYNLDGSNFSASNYGGSTTYFGGDVTGTASNYGGSTTYYNIGGKNFTGSNYGGSTTYYGGDLSGTASNYGGSTTYYNLGGKNFTGSNYGGSTTYFNGDITGTASNYGGNTTYYNIRDSFPSYKSSYPSPRSAVSPIYNTPSYNSPNYRSPAYNTPPKSTPKVYGGSPGEPTFPTEEAYRMWRNLKDNPDQFAKGLSRSFDEDAQQDKKTYGDFGTPDITGITSIGEGKVKITWKEVSETDKYAIFYGPSSGNYPFLTSTGSGNSHEIGGLSKGTKFFFVVQAELIGKTVTRGSHPAYYSPKGKEASIIVQ